jgi:hypothetical protein
VQQEPFKVAVAEGIAEQRWGIESGGTELVE